jgi:ribonuclease D
MPVERRVLAATTAQLADALAELGGTGPELVGVDVERADADRYWRHPALIQVGADGLVVLVDPQDGLDLTPLATFLRERSVILHAMDNDLAPLASVGVELHRIEDTAVAAAVLGLPTGLEALLDHLLDIRFTGDKQRMQRADWSRRPLPEPMLDYAASDVADLGRLWRTMRAELEAAGRWEWYVQERDAVREQPPLEERRAWTRLRGLGRLDRRSQTRARELWQVREELARDTDTAPGRIVADRVLLELARTPVTDARGLRRAGVRRQAARRFGEQLLEALRNGDGAEPVTRRGRRFDDRERTLVDELRARRTAVAEQHDLDPGVLCPNRALEQAVAAGPTTPEELRGALDVRTWQWELLADAFAEALADAVQGTSTPASD